MINDKWKILLPLPLLTALCLLLAAAGFDRRRALLAKFANGGVDSSDVEGSQRDAWYAHVRLSARAIDD